MPCFFFLSVFVLPHKKNFFNCNCFSSTLSKVCIDHSCVIYMTSDCGAIHVCPYHHSCISWRPHYPLNKPRLLLFSDGAIVCFFIWLCWGLWIWGCCGFGFSLSCFSWLLLRLVQCCPRCCFDVALRCLMVSLYFPLSYMFFVCFYPSPCPSPAVLSLCSSGFVPGVCPSFPRPRSVLSPHPPPPRPLTDPLPQSLAGTPCRTVWRKSIRQSNPESLPSGPSRERWVWPVRDQASLLHLCAAVFGTSL